MLKYDGKKFTFTAEADDVVTVYVNNKNATADMTVVIGGVENLVKSGAAVVLTQQVKAGDVEIQVHGTGYVTKIEVESQAYRDANAAVKSAQNVLNEKMQRQLNTLAISQNSLLLYVVNLTNRV